MTPLFLSMTLLLVYHAQVGSGCKVVVDCAFPIALPGVTVVDCPEPPPPGPPGPGGPQGNPPIDVTCCQDYTYTGGAMQRYLYDGSCPVAVEFKTLDLDVGETLTIRNIFCDTDEDACKMFVIDHTATAPFVLGLSNSNWRFSSGGADISVTFRVMNFECNDCLPADDQVECRLPNWKKFEDICYYELCELNSWDGHHQKCEVTATNTWQTEVVNTTMVRIRSAAQFAFLQQEMKLRTWLGLRCTDPQNTNWYWDVTVGHDDYSVDPWAFMLNTYTGVWDPNYPWAGANAHCAFAGPRDHAGENTNCDTYYWGMCERPAP